MAEMRFLDNRTTTKSSTTVENVQLLATYWRTYVRDNRVCGTEFFTSGPIHVPARTFQTAANVSN